MRKKILLTRLLEDNLEDRFYFQEKGFEILEIPLISLDMRKLEHDSVRALRESEWIFLTSSHAAGFLFLQCATNELSKKKYAVIGEKTRQVLLDKGAEVAFQSPFPTKAQMFESWFDYWQKPTSIFYPKSNLADRTGEKHLTQKGCKLFTPILYDNFFSEESRQALETCLKEEEITAVYLASPSLWHRFLSVFIEVGLKTMPELYCIGQTTQQTIEVAGFKAILKNE